MDVEQPGTPQFDLTLGLAEPAVPAPSGAAAAPTAATDAIDPDLEALNEALGADGMPPAEGAFVPSEENPGLPPRERIQNLLKEMRPCRSMLLKTIEACVAAPVPVAQVNELVESLQEHNRSVFSAADLCNLLRRAGALELVTAEGLPYEEARQEAVAVKAPEGDAAMLEAAEPPVAHWVATEAGREAVAADDPLARIQELFESDPDYLAIYKCVLELAAREGGVKTPALGAAVNNHPLLQRPRLFATYFVDRLEKAGAVEWTGAWTATDAGLAGLDCLLDVEGVEVPADVDAAQAPAYDFSNAPAFE